MRIIKNKIIIILLIVLALMIVLIYIYLNNKKEKKSDSYFHIETPIKKYSGFMSSVQGFPFKIVCNNNQIVTISITDGYLRDNQNIIDKNNSNKYIGVCNQTVYWNYLNDEEGKTNDIQTITIRFESSDSKFNKKEFTLQRNDNYEYYLLKKN